MAIDDWSGDIEIAPPTYKVRPFERYPNEFNEYGTITDPDDVAWLKKAMTKPVWDHSYKAIEIIARVNELKVKNYAGRSGFNVEVMTAQDAATFIAAQKRNEFLTSAKKHWWQIILVVIFLWWWFF